MSRYSAEPKPEIVTFRISPKLKSEFAEIAAHDEKPMGELLRQLVEQHVRQVRRREWEAEVRRQCREAAEAARDPNSDEAQVMRELDANFDEFARDLAAREEKPRRE